MKHTISPLHVYELRTREFLEVAKRQAQPTKAVNYVAGERNLVLMRPTKTERNTSQEGQAVNPAAPFNPQLFKTGMLIIFDCFIAAFDLYWILRIFL